MITFPIAKINLGLWVTGKRPDGFHDIESIFYPVDIHDILEIIPAPDSHISFSASGLPIPGETRDNLVIKAYQLMQENYNIPPLHVHLHKMIPMGSGTGGGSSDASFTIRMINDLFDLKLGIHEMAKISSGIGSDCPFFIDPRPTHVGGRGEILEPMELTLSKYQILLVFPGIIVSTKEAYRCVQPVKRSVALRDLVNLPVDQWKGQIINDFEEVIFSKYPLIREIQQHLYNHGAVYSSMTGSGSAVFGVFDKRVDVSVILRNYYTYLCPAKE